jgi:hypothetical protein
VSSRIALVLTSISPPSRILAALAEGAVSAGMDFIIAGDTKSPADFSLGGASFWISPRSCGVAFAWPATTRRCPLPEAGSGGHATAPLVPSLGTEAVVTFAVDEYAQLVRTR